MKSEKLTMKVKVKKLSVKKLTSVKTKNLSSLYPVEKTDNRKVKPVTKRGLKKLFNNLENIKDTKDPAINNLLGSVIFKGIKLQISIYNLSTKERVLQLYYRRKLKGLCVMCGLKVTKKNPRTKKLYRMCDMHREKIDKKTVL